MKNKALKSAAVLFTASIMMACNPLNKMSKNAETITYDVVPNPLEMHGGDIALAIKGSYPEKYFHKKAIIEVTPTLTWEGGSKEFEKTVLIGEAADGEGTVIKNAGGSFSFSDTIPYVDGMDNAVLELVAIAKFKTKEKEFPKMEIGKGTMVTSLLVQNDEKPIMGNDGFTKTVPKSIALDIHYSIQSAQVAGKELRDDDYKAFKAFMDEGMEKGYTWKGVSVSAYASPDGELTKNENLADNRATSAAKSVGSIFRKKKIEAAKADGFYATEGKGEDWNGFKAAMSTSDIKDKELIIRILEMYTDLEKRETEIKNLAATYLELKDEILPNLRRSQITINAEETSRTDEEISKLADSAPDSLNVEELLYAATLTDDMDKKMKIYESCAKVHKDDWRGHNNIGYLYILQNKPADAQTALSAAAGVAKDNPVVNNNLGILARWNGDNEKAMEFYESASGAGSEVGYNKGIINIIDADYSGAVANMGAENTFNSGLARLLNGDAEGCLKAVDASDSKSTAMAYYLKAVAGSRTDNKDLVINNLKTAIGKDGSLGAKAKTDAEFIKYREDSEFQTLTN